MRKIFKENALKKNIIKIKIDKIVFGGEGLGYYNGFAVFVPMSVPVNGLRKT